MEEQTHAPVQPRPAPPKKAKRTWRRLSLIETILLIMAIAAAVFFYVKYHDSQNKLNHPDVVAKAETQSLVDKVGRLVQLPSGESPTVATVSDVSKLSNQTFFAHAQNGDKVLIYSKAREAILYRPSTDKVVNVAPLNVTTK